MKKRTFLFIVLSFLLGAGFTLLIVLLRNQTPLLESASEEYAASQPTEVNDNKLTFKISPKQDNLSAKKVLITRVIDGDTIETVDGRRIRYIGIDTPETSDPRKPVECFGREATAKNKELVLNKQVVLEKDVSETDKYGRLLRYVWLTLPDRGEVMVNEVLVEEGYAFAATFPPDVKYQQRFLAAQRRAQEAGRGLWSGCPLTQAPSQTPGLNGKTLENENIKNEIYSLGATTDCIIKGNINSKGEKIYHLPGCRSYNKTVIDETKGERWFCTEEEALKAGWRKAKNC